MGDLPAFDALAELSTTGVAVARVAAVDAESPAVVADRADLVVEGPAGAVALLERLAQAWE
jgi:trehalose 6-phosphate phosphatase